MFLCLLLVKRRRKVVEKFRVQSVLLQRKKRKIDGIIMKIKRRSAQGLISQLEIYSD